MGSFEYPCCCCCCCYFRAAVWRLHWSAFSSQKDCVWQRTRFGGRKWSSGLNRISHHDWVKLSVKLDCASNQNTKFFLSLQIWHFHVLPLRARLSLGVMAMKEYPTFLKISDNGISWWDGFMSYQRDSLVVEGVLPLCRDAVGIFYSPTNISVQ